MKTIEHELGTLIEAPQFIAFFGNHKSNIEALKKAFPDLHFKRIHQVHGDVIVETHQSSVDFELKADAHWTKEKNLALCIATADCTPAMIYDDQNKSVCAIHAGWRGVVQRIIPKSLELLSQNKATPEKIHVLIGPHIQKESFEVEHTVRNDLVNSLLPEHRQQSGLWLDLNETKSLVDLHLAVKSQISEYLIPKNNLLLLKEDTKPNAFYHSYRRDKEKSGRNISFIALR